MRVLSTTVAKSSHDRNSTPGVVATIHILARTVYTTRFLVENTLLVCQVLSFSMPQETLVSEIIEIIGYVRGKNELLASGQVRRHILF